MEEREVTRLLQQFGDRVTPGPPPLRRIVDEGEALRGRRSGRMRMYAIAAAAAAVVGGGSLAATVLDFPSITTATQDSAGGNAESAGGAGGGEEMAPEAAPGGGGGGSDEGATAADAVVPASVTPDVAGPGDRVRIEVPTDVAFGAEWSLERSVGGTWEPQFFLVDADFAVENGVPLSRPADSPEALADVPEPKDGPVTLLVPDAATPGPYRICQTIDDGTAWCGSLTVTD